MTTQAIPYIVLLSFLFGSTLIASRFGVGQFHPVSFLGLRTLLASMSFGAVYLFSHRRRTLPTDPQLWRHAIVLGVFGTAIPMMGVVTSLQYLSSGLTAILITAGPAMTVLLAHVFLPDESLTVRRGLGVVLALGGALLIALRGENGLPDVSQTNPLGYILVFVAMIFGSSMNVYSRKYMRHFDSLDVSSIRILITALIVLPIAILLVGIDLQPVTGQGYFALVYAAVVGNFAGIFLLFYNIKRFGVTAAAMSEYLIPVFAGLGGVLILGEQLTVGMIVGMALIVIGIALINRRRRMTSPKPV